MSVSSYSRKLSNSLLKCLIIANNNSQICSLSTTGSCHSYYKFWKEKRNLTRCGNEYGPLTDLPDWSYMDGRPAPLGVRQKDRYLKQVELTKKVVNMLNEVEFAKKHHHQNEEAKRNYLKLRLETKLKQKGGFVETKKKSK